MSDAKEKGVKLSNCERKEGETLAKHEKKEEGGEGERERERERRN